jgi:septum formation protein
MALILASSSAIRKAMLEAAGIDVDVVPPEVDESAVKQRLTSAGDIALRLAEAKARDGATRRPGDWTIGSDSVVSVAGRLFDKPRDRGQAAEHLHAFSGRPMTLTSAVALSRDGELEWSYVASAELQVRPLSDEFIERYLDAEWPEVGYCVGVFRLEGRGVQLFERIDGDHWTILGMPLLPLLAALRDRGVIAA